MSRCGYCLPNQDNKWVSLVQCVPKKGGMAMITNENNEFIPTSTVTRWRICMNYTKLMKPLGRIITQFFLLIICWTGQLGKNIIVFWITNQGTTKF